MGRVPSNTLHEFYENEQVRAQSGNWSLSELLKAWHRDGSRKKKIRQARKTRGRTAQ